MIVIFFNRRAFFACPVFITEKFCLDLEYLNDYRGVSCIKKQNYSKIIEKEWNLDGDRTLKVK
jgi:hypothetical protein